MSLNPPARGRRGSRALLLSRLSGSPLLLPLPCLRKFWFGASEGLLGLFTGFWSLVLRELPFNVIEMCVARTLQLHRNVCGLGWRALKGPLWVPRRTPSMGDLSWLGWPVLEGPPWVPCVGRVSSLPRLCIHVREPRRDRSPPWGLQAVSLIVSRTGQGHLRAHAAGVVGAAQGRPRAGGLGDLLRGRGLRRVNTAYLTIAYLTIKVCDPLRGRGLPRRRRPSRV